MSSSCLVTDAELEQLYPQEVHDRVAGLLKVQSDSGRAKLRNKVVRIARDYDLGFADMAMRPLKSEIRKPLKNIQELALKLGLAIADSNGYARSEVGYALSKVRKERKLANGDDVLSYGHECSNEATFDRESLGYFIESLISLNDHIDKIAGNLERGGRPAGPEQDAIINLAKLWKDVYDKAPFEQSLRPFQELCEVTLRPIAVRRGKKPNLADTARNVLYLYDLKPPAKWWEV